MPWTGTFTRSLRQWPWAATVSSVTSAVHVFDLGVPRADQADQPGVAEPEEQRFVRGRAADERLGLLEFHRDVDQVGLRLLRDLDAVDPGDGLGQRTRHPVRVAREFPPQFVIEQGVQLGGDEPHLRSELERALPQDLETFGRLRITEDDGLAEQRAVLVRPQAEHVDPATRG